MKLPFGLGEITSKGIGTNSPLVAFLICAITSYIGVFSGLFLAAYIKDGVTPVEIISKWVGQ